MRKYAFILGLTFCGCAIPAGVHDSVVKLEQDFPKVAAALPMDGVDATKYQAAVASITSTLKLLDELTK